MALQFLAANPKSSLHIVPCSMHYQNGHNFRSRVVIDFGEPIQIAQDVIETFNQGNEQEAISKVQYAVVDSISSMVVAHTDNRLLSVRKLSLVRDCSLTLSSGRSSNMSTFDQELSCFAFR